MTKKRNLLSEKKPKNIKETLLNNREVFLEEEKRQGRIKNRQKLCEERNEIYSLFRLVRPDDNDYRNPVYKDFIENYGVQLISFKFYVVDSELKMNEEFFAKHMSAFVPLSTAITVVKNKT